VRLAEPIATSFDDTEVLALLVKLGISHRLEFTPGLPVNSVDCFIKDHPTHWLLFSRHRGFPNPKDNGYAVVGLFKKAFSESDAERFLADALARRKAVPKQVVGLPTGFPQPQS
jgi:hypothetical protein